MALTRSLVADGTLRSSRTGVAFRSLDRIFEREYEGESRLQIISQSLP